MLTILSFKIGPRINAAGRIETGTSSVELLIADNEAFALDMGRYDQRL